MMLNVDFMLRLLVAGILGAIIGLDREYRAKEAGYRTHFLVSLGSALIMIVSQYGFQEIIKENSVTLDPSRVAAQVVSGIGFIGAGTIILQKQIVRILYQQQRYFKADSRQIQFKRLYDCLLRNANTTSG